MSASDIIQVPGGYYASFSGVVLFVPDDPGNRHYQMVQTAIDGGATVSEPPEPPEAVPAELTRLQIRDEAVAQSLWTLFRGFIEDDAERLERWQLAVAIPTDDPILDDMQTALGWTLEQRQAFLIEAAKR